MKSKSNNYRGFLCTAESDLIQDNVMYALLQDVIRFQQQENTTDYFLFNIECTDGI